MDLTTLTDEEFADLAEAVRREEVRRRDLSSIPEQVDALNRAYLNADGAVEGERWRQPTGAHDAYPLGWVVAHPDDVTLWESLVAGNVWEPGVSGWRRKVGADEWPAWVAPTGAHDAYPAGAQVTHLDLRWTSDSDGNVWEPGVFGWTVAGS